MPPHDYPYYQYIVTDLYNVYEWHLVQQSGTREHPAARNLPGVEHVSTLNVVTGMGCGGWTGRSKTEKMKKELTDHHWSNGDFFSLH